MFPSLDVSANSAEGRSRLGGALNPHWVELLMGVPLNWTALEPQSVDLVVDLAGTAEWEMGVARVTPGTPDRVDRIRLLGNGVVPQTAAKAWQVLDEELLND